MVESSWCVRDPTTGKAVVVAEMSLADAVKAGVDALIEDYPDLMACSHCERPAIYQLEVWQLDQGAATLFRHAERYELTTDADPAD